MVDNYFSVLAAFEEKIEAVDQELMAGPNPEILQTLHTLKRDLIFIRKSIRPLREVIQKLRKGESTLINEYMDIFFQDLYEHLLQVVEEIESYQDVVSGLLENYQSQVSNRMNDVMKILTIFAAIFIPLTFIAGIYAMNFKNLSWNGPGDISARWLSCWCSVSHS